MPPKLFRSPKHQRFALRFDFSKSTDYKNTRLMKRVNSNVKQAPMTGERSPTRTSAAPAVKPKILVKLSIIFAIQSPASEGHRRSTFRASEKQNHLKKRDSSRINIQLLEKSKTRIMTIDFDRTAASRWSRSLL